MVGYYNSFVVRIWSDEEGQLRGSIEHVLTHEGLVFNDPGAIVGFIHTHLAPPPFHIPDPVEERLDEIETSDDEGPPE